jgi:hypothetical protein
MDFVARVRRDWFLVLVTIIAPIAAVYFFLPARPVGPEELELREGHFVGAAITFDRVEPLPWSFHDSSGTVHTRFALGWIGKRALVIKTKRDLPPGTTLSGDLYLLSDVPKKWVDETPEIAAVAYGMMLDLTRGGKGVLVGVMAIGFGIGAVVGWLWRFLSPMAPARARDGKDQRAIDLGAPPPRANEVVAEVVRRHAPSDGFAVYLAIYALLVLELPFLVAAINGEPNFWDAASALRLFGMYGLGFVVAAPVSISLFVWWARRRRAAFGRIARDGAIAIGVIADATPWLARAKTRHTVLDINVTSEAGTQCYHGSVRGLRDWARAGTPVHVLATATERLAIVIAPTGEGFATKRAVDPFRV